MLTSIILLGLIIWLIAIYNLLVRDRTRVHTLIPKLVGAVKQYASYESATLAAVTEFRAESEKMERISDKGKLESELGASLHKLLAVAEDYPELKASQGFLDLQYNLTEVEKNIQYARRYYNGAVRNLNVRIASFPSLLVAKLFQFKPAQFFELTDLDERNVPET